MKKLIALVVAVLCIAALSLPVFAEDQYTELVEIVAIVAQEPTEADTDNLVYKYIFKANGDIQELIDSASLSYETWWGVGELDTEDPANCSMCHAGWPGLGWTVEGSYGVYTVDKFNPDLMDAQEEWQAVVNGGMVGYICELTGNTGYADAPFVTEKDNVVMDAKGRHTVGIKANADMSANQYSFGGPWDALVLTVIPESCFNYQTGEITPVPEEWKETKPAETEPKATEAPKPVETEPKATEAPAATDAPKSTDAPAETKAPEKKSGCGSAIASLAVIPMVIAAAYVCKKH